MGVGIKRVWKQHIHSTILEYESSFCTCWGRRSNGIGSWAGWPDHKSAASPESAPALPWHRSPGGHIRGNYLFFYLSLDGCVLFCALLLLFVSTCISLYENSRFMTMSWVRTSVLSIRSLIRESSFASSSPWYFSLAFLMSFSRVSLKEALQKKTYTSIIYMTTGYL